MSTIATSKEQLNPITFDCGHQTVPVIIVKHPDEQTETAECTIPLECRKCQ